MTPNIMDRAERPSSYPNTLSRKNRQHETHRDGIQQPWVSCRSVSPLGPSDHGCTQRTGRGIEKGRSDGGCRQDVDGGAAIIGDLVGPFRICW